MKKLTANIIETENYLDSHFQTIENGQFTINVEYLLDAIKIVIDNTEYLINKVTSDRRTKIHSIVFSGILELCNIELKHSEHIATSYHIKDWFKGYGMNYKEILKPLIEEYTEERKEALRIK